MAILEKLITSYAKKENDTIQKSIDEYSKLLPSEVRITRNLSYKSEAFDGRINVYHLDKSDEEKKPVIVNVHGGGLVCGMMEQNDLQCARLAQMGYVVFAVEYPLLPGADVFDMYRVLANGLNYISANLDGYGCDGDNVFWTGDSAGAYLITNLAVLKCHEEMRKEFKVAEINLPLKALGLFSGMFYTDKKDKIGLTLTDLMFGRGYKKKSFYRYTNLEKGELLDVLPPVYMQTSYNDMLKDHSLCFYKALENRKHNVRLRNFEKDKRLVHAFAALYPEYAESRAVYKEMKEYFEGL